MTTAAGLQPGDVLVLATDLVTLVVGVEPKESLFLIEQRQVVFLDCFGVYVCTLDDKEWESLLSTCVINR